MGADNDGAVKTTARIPAAHTFSSGFVTICSSLAPWSMLIRPNGCFGSFGIRVKGCQQSLFTDALSPRDIAIGVVKCNALLERQSTLATSMEQGGYFHEVS